MKFKTQIKTRFVDMTIGDTTQRIEQTYEEKVPVVPRDWDAIGTRVGFALVGLLTLISIVWSTVSIGAMLGGGVGFLAALLFDVSWAICLILEWKSRFDPTKRAFPRNLGWVLLGVTMLFVGWHGWVLDNIPMAVVGASVSMFAKVLWLGIMKHVDRDLSPEHLQWVEKTISEANARIAVAEVMRQVANIEDAAVAHRLAIELSRKGLGETIVVRESPLPTPDTAGRLPGTAGQAPDTAAALPSGVPGQPGQQNGSSVLTGSAIVRRLSEDDLDIIRDCQSAAQLVRTLAGHRVRTLPDILEVVRELNLRFKEGTIDREIRRQGGKAKS